MGENIIEDFVKAFVVIVLGLATGLSSRIKTPAVPLAFVSAAILATAANAYTRRIERNATYSPADPTRREVCPCCDYVSLAERGKYLICPVCFWEDDGLDVDQIDEHSGPNHITLRDGRANFAMFGACDEKMIPKVCSPAARAKFERRPRNVR